jgi:RNA polymerase sigma-70 factor, ECF subfamily
MSLAADELLRAAGRGDPAAWRQLLETYAGRVYALVYRRCGDRDLAEEITQATFVKVSGKLRGYRELGRFEAWLFRIALNGLRDEMRRRKRHAVTVDFTVTPPESLGHRGDGPPPHEALERGERAAMLRAAVARLPEADRQIIELRYVAELTFSQIAEVLDEPLGTVLARGHRALKKLRQMLSEEPAAEDGHGSPG